MKALIWDMDGVIVDSERAYEERDRQWFARKGIQVDLKALRQLMGCTNDLYWQRIAQWNPQQDMAQVRREYLDDCRAHPIDYAALFRPAVRDLLQSCRQQGILSALASSSTMETIRQVLTACGLDQAFDLVVSGAQLPASKPDPAIFTLCARKMNVAAEECTVIEDSCNGVMAGKRAGMRVIGLRDPLLDQDLSEADRVIEDLRQLQIRQKELIVLPLQEVLSCG